MTDKKEIKEVIVVEGRDDTAAINCAVNGFTIETHGFGIKESTWKLIEKAYHNQGIIVFTDPDYAGENIRKRILEKYPNAKQAFLTTKEAYRDGDIGIENACPEDIIKALDKAMCTYQSSINTFDAKDLEDNGLSGMKDSKEKREKLGSLLGIGYGNSRAFLKKLNQFNISKEKFYEKMKEIE